MFPWKIYLIGVDMYKEIPQFIQDILHVKDLLLYHVIPILTNQEVLRKKTHSR